MRALVLESHGGLENLKVVDDLPIPAVVDGHVLIRVRASSFNYHDVFTVRGMPGIKVPLPVVIGLDMAGEISEVGPGVTGWNKGDRVLVNPLNKKKGLMGEMMDGGMAQYCLVDAEQLIRMPEFVAFEDAASLPVAYGTAHRMLVTHNTIKGRRPRFGARRFRGGRHGLRAPGKARRSRSHRLRGWRKEDAAFA
jgi:alcohol dehydrogenase